MDRIYCRKVQVTLENISLFLQDTSEKNVKMFTIFLEDKHLRNSLK
jgi:hypothetical protein